ncbi:MAG: YaeQ family protein, partial [Betaproteobacteria bacterium]|nr:YaeQ family protein [Betaproteobacteria bacterium]
LALHPSETEERLLIRLLAFALKVPADTDSGALQFARGLSDTDEPDLWQHDLSGQLIQWIEVGQPDERRLARACGRAERVSIYVYGSAAAIWWAGIRNKVTRLSNLEVWQIESEQSLALAALAQRAMQWQLTVQDGTIWVSGGQSGVDSSVDASVELTPIRLNG